MRRSLVALAVVFVVGLAGCGGDDDSEESSSTPTTATASARGGRFCELLRSYSDRFARTRSVSEPGQLRDLLRDARSDIKEAREVAPPDVKADAENVARVFDEYVTALEKVDYNASRVPVDVAQRLAAPEFVSGGQRIEVYARTNC